MRIPFMLLVGAVMTAGACSDYTGPGDPGDPGDPGNDVPPSAQVSVAVQDNQFVSPTVRVLTGGTVTWTWRGATLHNVTFSGGGPTSATQIAGTFERTFATAGTFSYLCTVHGQSMSGTITVVAPN